MSDKLRDFIVTWNNNFPLDRVYRRKYNIPFNSQQHKNLCQIDVLLDLLEDDLFKDYYQEQLERQSKLKQYQDTGRFFVITAADEEARFNKFIPLNPEKFKDLKKESNYIDE